MVSIIEQLAIGSVTLVGTVGLLLARKLDRIAETQGEQGERLARIEGALGNGMQSQIRGTRETQERMQEELRTHVDGEEERIVGILKRRGY